MQVQSTLIPSLRDLCVDSVTRSFSSGELVVDFRGLKQEDIQAITTNLPLDLPLELAGVVIHDEEYWRRRAIKRWKNCQVQAHGESWKQLFYERNLRDALELFDADASDVVQLRRLLTFR